MDFIICSLDLDSTGTSNCKHCECFRLFHMNWYFCTDTTTSSADMVTAHSFWLYKVLESDSFRAMHALRQGTSNNFEITKYTPTAHPRRTFQCIFISLRLWHTRIARSCRNQPYRVWTMLVSWFSEKSLVFYNVFSNDHKPSVCLHPWGHRSGVEGNPLQYSSYIYCCW